MFGRYSGETDIARTSRPADVKRLTPSLHPTRRLPARWIWPYNLAFDLVPTHKTVR